MGSFCLLSTVPDTEIQIPFTTPADTVLNHFRIVRYAPVYHQTMLDSRANLLLTVWISKAPLFALHLQTTGSSSAKPAPYSFAAAASSSC